MKESSIMTKANNKFIDNEKFIELAEEDTQEIEGGINSIIVHMMDKLINFCSYLFYD